MLWKKANRNYWAVVEQERSFVGIQVFTKAFIDSLNQVDIIFKSKVIILPNNSKHYLEIQRPLNFRWQWHGHQTFKLFNLNKDFPKLTYQTS